MTGGVLGEYSHDVYRHRNQVHGLRQIAQTDYTTRMSTALLVVDMQNAFSSMVAESLPNVTKLIAHFQGHNLPIIFTQHGHTDDELTPPFRNQLVRKWGADGSIRVGTESWDFIPEIKELINESPIVPKNTYDAFLGSKLKGLKLEDVLNKEDVERVVVCGVMTDCCCDTTGRGAFNRGFETWLVGDACGSANKAQHRRGLQVFEFGFGEVVTTRQVVDRLE